MKELLNTTFANVFAESFTALMLLVLLFGCLQDHAWAQRRSGQHFIMWNCVMLVMLGTDSALWLLEDVPGRQLLLRVLACVSTSCTYWIYGAGVLCVMDWVEEKRPMNKWVRRGMMALPRAMAVLCLIPYLHRLVIDYTPGGAMVYGPLHMIFNYLGLVEVVMLAGILLYYRKALGHHDTFAALVLIIVPAVSAVQESWGPTLGMVLSGMSMLLLYLTVCQRRSRELALAEQALSETQLNALVVQIQPHFIFNSLTAIRSLCKESPEARDALADFSDYLRMNIHAFQSKDPIPFSREMEHIRTYLRFEQLRFGDKLKIEEQLECQDFTVPALTVQPLVENAAKHGLRGKPEGGTIRIRTWEAEDGVHVSVTDDGLGFDTKAVPGPEHVGLANVRRRLAMSCGGTLAIESKPGEGTRSEILLPKTKKRTA